jgi:2-dehydro-3-deoxygluconokinase
MMEKRFDVVAIGECLVEFNQLSSGLYAHSYAGDTLNTSFYASRLGMRIGYITAIGEDPFGEDIVPLLNLEGIDHTMVATIADRSNGIYFILTEEGEKRYHFLRRDSAATRMLEHQNLDVLRTYIDSSHWLHLSLTSIGIQHDKQKLFELLEDIGDTKISFDANYRASVWPSTSAARECYERMLPYVTMLFVTDTDHETMYGESDFFDAIRRYQSLGVARLAYRMGKNGSVLFDGKAQSMPAHDALVVDTTGAGDAFNAGFLYSSRNGRSFKECGQFATACAAVAIGEQGGMSQGFTKEQVMALLEEDSGE